MESSCRQSALSSDLDSACRHGDDVTYFKWQSYNSAMPQCSTTAYDVSGDSSKTPSENSSTPTSPSADGSAPTSPCEHEDCSVIKSLPSEDSDKSINVSEVKI